MKQNKKTANSPVRNFRLPARGVGMGAWRCLSAGLCVSLLIVCALPHLVWGHIDLDPRQSIPKKWELYTINVPTETDAPTVDIRLQVPAAFEIEVIEHNRIWRIDTERDERGFIRQVRWSGSEIPAQRFESFKFLARNPATTGIYRWSIEQHYQSGEPGRWEAQTQIVALEEMGGKRAESAWRSAQVATTVSLVAIGIAVVLIIITVIHILQYGRQPTAD